VSIGDGPGDVAAAGALELPLASNVESINSMTNTLLVLILPGIGNSGPEHWQSHWERRDPRCTRVLQDEWDAPECAEWVARLDAAISRQAEPVVLAAHSSACALVAHWATAPASHTALIRGALLVAPSDPGGPNYPLGPTGFGPVPLRPLPFVSIVVASSDDRYVTASRAREYADAWGSRFVALENAGHINVASGFGPWDEGFDLLQTLR
jgi:predicted alpha/beta hydrolase family esterase